MITANQISGIETMNVADAKTVATALIETHPRKTQGGKLAKAQILRDIQAASRSSEISRIMWAQLLAAEGLSSGDSSWGKTYR